jgi:cobyrinic acid a,c-diamide synthase
VTYESERPAAWYLPGGAGGSAEGIGLPHLHASYLHVHWTATPDVPARFVAAARLYAGIAA